LTLLHTADQLIELYETKDAAMRSALPISEVQAYSTCTFDQIGWPHRVTRAADLIRYADWCNHPGANDYFLEDAVLPTQCADLKFTAAEAALLRQVSDACGSMTAKLGHEVRVVLNHLAQIGPFRIMMEIRRRLGLDRLTVFDVGAGSGYQAALLALAGNRVVITDNAQGLFLFQSLLLEACRPGEVRHWLADGPVPSGLDEAVQMIPWWDYLALRHSRHRNVDVFFCNNNLGEMNYGAAAYTVHLAKQMMADSKVKAFFFTCLGTPKQSSFEMIDALLARAGFVNVVSDPFWLYLPQGHALPSGLLDFATAIPRWNAQQGEALRTVRDVIDVRDRQLPTDLDFVAFTGVFDLHKALAAPARPSPSRTPPTAPRSPTGAAPAGAAGLADQPRGNVLSRVVEGLLDLPKLPGLKQTHQALMTENTALKAQLAAVGAELKAARDQIAAFQRRGP
jgi:hypothetical protein